MQRLSGIPLLVSPPATMTSFCMVIDNEINVTISRMKSSTCALVSIPNKCLIQPQFNPNQCLSQETTRINNISLELVIFLTAFKTAMLKPLLRKPDLALVTLTISGQSPILQTSAEDYFLHDHLNTNNILKSQLGYWTNHITLKQL